MRHAFLLYRADNGAHLAYEISFGGQAIERLSDKEKTLQGEMTSLAAKWKADEQELLETLEKEREAHKITTSEKNNLEKVMRDSELQLKRTKEEVQKLTEKLETVTKQREKAEEEKAEVEHQVRKQMCAFTAVQSSVRALRAIQGILEEELCSETTLCTERLAEVTRLQGEVKSLVDKVHSLESRNSELSRKLIEEEDRFKKSIKEKDDAIGEGTRLLRKRDSMPVYHVVEVPAHAPQPTDRLLVELNM